MSTTTLLLPRKGLTPVECRFLKLGNRQLLEKTHGRIGSATFMDIVADWGASKSATGFEEFARLWIAEGNAKNKIADKLLRELFGMDEPTPRKAA